MSTLAKLKRFYLLVEKLENSHFPPSFNEIYRDYKEEGYTVSQRTIQRDIETLRNKFGIEIVYDKHKEGYYVDRNRSVNVNTFYRFLEYAKTAELLSESFGENKKNLDYIHFEAQGKLKGLNWLKDLMYAIQNKRWISFTHYKFTSEEGRNYELKPFGLKEYQNRWYVVGEIEKIDNPLKFGVDRIKNLQVLNDTFQDEIPPFDMNELFDDVIGLHAEKEKEKVILHFEPFQGKYIKTLPLHPSQEILEDNEKGVKVQLNVRPNFELIQKIMMQCQAVKVLQPQWLAEEMQNIYREALNKYKN
jgi:predicted DNA-binding transcriptional regulator YafY